MSVETLTAEKWLYEALTGSPSLMAAIQGGVHADQAPDESLHPLVVFQEQASTDRKAVGSFRTHVEGVYIVRAIHETGSFADADLVAAAVAIDVALDRASGTVDDGEVWGCVREAPFRMRDGKYRHLGGQYRLWVTRT